MDNLDLIKQKVKRDILAGHSRASSFVNILREHGYNFGEFPTEEIESWFECIENRKFCLNSPENPWFLTKFHLLLQTIQTEIEKSRRGCEARHCGLDSSCKLKFLSARYAIDAREVAICFRSFVLIDVLFGEKRELILEGSLPQALHSYDYKIRLINSEYFMFIDSSNRFEAGERCFIYLLKLDYTNLKTKVLDKFETRGNYDKLTIDSSDPSRFFFTLWHNDQDYLHFGRLDNEKLKFSKNMVKHSDILVCNFYKLDGNKLHGIKCGEEGENATFKYNEMRIDSGNVKLVQEVELTKSGVCGKELIVSSLTRLLKINCHFHSSRCTWPTFNQCYILCEFESTPLQLLQVDLHNKSIRKVKEFETFFFNGILLDDNNVLAISTKNMASDQHVFYRLQLGQPDHLINLCSTVLHKHCFFLNNCEYEKIMQRLPATSMPFGQKQTKDILLDGLAGEFSRMEIV